MGADKEQKQIVAGDQSKELNMLALIQAAGPANSQQSLLGARGCAADYCMTDRCSRLSPAHARLTFPPRAILPFRISVRPLIIRRHLTRHVKK